MWGITSMRGFPSLLSPVNSFDGAVKVIEAGADEIYCGVTIPELEDLILYRGKPCEVQTYDELGKIVRYAHSSNVKVFVTVNLPFVVKSMEKFLEKHIRLCVEEGVDGLIIGNFGVLSLVRKMQINIPLLASTFFMTMNYESVRFLEKAGFERIILERHLTIDEISEIVRKSKVDIEVFIHNGGCSNINGNCYLLHIIYPKLKQALSGSFTVNPPCTLPFDLYAHDGRKIGSRVPVLDAFAFCSICSLSDLVRTGVSGFKIVGRCLSGEYIAGVTKIYRKLLDLLRRGLREEFERRVELMKAGRDPLITSSPELQFTHKIMCGERRCYYNYSPVNYARYTCPT